MVRKTTLRSGSVSELRAVGGRVGQSLGRGVMTRRERRGGEGGDEGSDEGVERGRWERWTDLRWAQRISGWMGAMVCW